VKKKKKKLEDPPDPPATAGVAAKSVAEIARPASHQNAPGPDGASNPVPQNESSKPAGASTNGLVTPSTLPAHDVGEPSTDRSLPVLAAATTAEQVSILRSTQIRPSWTNFFTYVHKQWTSLMKKMTKFDLERYQQNFIQQWETTALF
jgi:hypothetical protein